MASGPLNSRAWPRLTRRRRSQFMRPCAWRSLAAAAMLSIGAMALAAAASDETATKLRTNVASFNANDVEDPPSLIPNVAAADWLIANAPRFECPSAELEEIYNFRWWTFRKH